MNTTNATTVVKFEASREQTPMATVDGKVAFPEAFKQATTSNRETGRLKLLARTQVEK